MNDWSITLPPWYGMHPIVTHFPIALFPTALLFIALSIVWKRFRLAFCIVSMILLTIAAIGSVVAVATGSEARIHTAIPLEADTVMSHHAQMAASFRTFNSLFTIVYAIFILLALVKTKLGEKIFLPASILLLGIGCLLLWQLTVTGHLGGRLVHEFGVHAKIY